MIIFVALILTVATFAFIAYPLRKQATLAKQVANDDKQHELYSKRDTIYSMLKELEFDFQSGILTEDDYDDLSKRYKNQAISILKQLDDTGKETSIGDEIEKQVLRLRHGKGTLHPDTLNNSGKNTIVEEKLEKQNQKLRQSAGRFCSQCGAEYQPDDRFCSRCSTSLSKRENLD